MSENHRTGFGIYLVSGMGLGDSLLNHYAYYSKEDIFHHFLHQITICITFVLF